MTREIESILRFVSSFERYIGWNDNHATTGQGVILGENISQKYIKIYYDDSFLRRSRLKICQGYFNLAKYRHVSYTVWVNNPQEVIIHVKQFYSTNVIYISIDYLYSCSVQKKKNLSILVEFLETIFSKTKPRWKCFNKFFSYFTRRITSFPILLRFPDYPV